MELPNKKMLFLMFSINTMWGVPMYEEHLYCVLMAGGSGTRLWPLSRESRPKQLLPMCSDATLLEQAIDRIAPLVCKERIWISTTAQHEKNIVDAVGHVVGAVIAEPGSRNTGPAMLLCAMQIYQQDPDAIIVFLPADAFIPQRDSKKFREFIVHAIDYAAQEDELVLLGVQPSYPATGYGYIEFDKQAREQAPYPVKHFREKPSLEVAERYVEQGNYLWNISIFCAKAAVFMNEFKEHASAMFAGVESYVKGQSAYQSVVADSIDYAVVERSKRICVLPVDFNWCDVGNIEVFLSLKQQYNTLDAKFIAYDAHRNLVDVPGKLVALVGVDDLCIVEVDDALLITKRKDAENVRYIIKLLKQGGYTKHL